MLTILIFKINCVEHKYSIGWFSNLKQLFQIREPINIEQNMLKLVDVLIYSLDRFLGLSIHLS